MKCKLVNRWLNSWFFCPWDVPFSVSSAELPLTSQMTTYWSHLQKLRPLLYMHSHSRRFHIGPCLMFLANSKSVLPPQLLYNSWPTGTTAYFMSQLGCLGAPHPNMPALSSYYTTLQNIPCSSCQFPVLWLEWPLWLLRSQDTLQPQPPGNFVNVLLAEHRSYIAPLGPHSDFPGREKECKQTYACSSVFIGIQDGGA